ncbi:MAG: glycoside hydrolase family 15 [Intrasporangium sp.]|uniref:glycoside hydrolase family 15 n=1 Tax=Intrasporangium sp. TaxID=1925024 RepID=UPI0026482B65|nr:glycoside hydrolase family 15 [Intrasporangium sp.]MDN5795809.1 glycoside hydrolase family 15 [Intrasporangium sp.]
MLSRRSVLIGALAVGAGGGVVVDRARTAAPLPTLANGASWRQSPVQAARDWLTGGTVPGSGAPDGLVAEALMDLHGLLGPDGAVLAGPAGIWRYVWPRDASFVVVALAATGHLEQAWATLRFLSRVQLPDGGFEARYLPDGSGPPDDRQRQSDGAGWVLWALDMARSVSGASAIPADLRLMRDRAASFVDHQTSGATTLPVASPDYWEVPERAVTLGTISPMATGLEAAARTCTAEGNRSAAARWSGAAGRLSALVVRELGPAYDRYGRSGGGDAATPMLLPPFAVDLPPDVLSAWSRYAVEARRPAGGLAPGTGWRADGVSWTAETALVAYTAAAIGRRDEARRWLAWLAAHRTAWGSVPEKVRADGRAAGPAPLAWTAALIVLTAHELDRRS